MQSFRKTNRLTKYDYSQPGYYFVTVCTSNKAECFGEVENSAMILNEAGRIAEKFWQEIPKHYQNVNFDIFTVMPNHIHGIVIIELVGAASGRLNDRTIGCLKKEAGNARPYISLSTIIGSYKNIVSKTIHKLCSVDFQWQKTFYDHVIRKDESLDKIREYIRNNPLKWELDRNNPANLWM